MRNIRIKDKPKIFTVKGYGAATKYWYLNFERMTYTCINWQEALETFNKLRFERIVNANTRTEIENIR